MYILNKVGDDTVRRDTNQEKKENITDVIKKGFEVRLSQSTLISHDRG